MAARRETQEGRCVSLSPEAGKDDVRLRRSTRGGYLARRLLSSTDSGGPPTVGGPPALLSPPIHLSVSARDTHVWSNGPAEMTHKITIAVRVATLGSSGRRQRDGPHLLATAMVLL